MKKKIVSFLNKYWILLSFLSIFTIYILPVCFQNNNNLNVIAAEHVDSGSITGSILQMFNKASFYNQNIPFHTLYGFPYNSLLFFIFAFLKAIGLSSITNFTYFGLSARLLNYLISILVIIEIFKLSKKILKYNFSIILLFSLFLIFPQFIQYSFHIKPDILGLLLSIISLNYLFDFLQNPKNNKNIIKANIFGGLSILCKQPHIFILIPLFIGFIFTLRGDWKEKIKRFFTIYLYSGIIFLVLFFLIHPYAFIKPSAFIGKQTSLLGMTSASYIDNFNFWLPAYTRDPLLFITAFTPFIFLLLTLFKKFRNKKILFLFLVSTYLITYLVWLTFKVGPMRFIAYLIPIVPFSVLLFSYILDFSFKEIFHSKSKVNRILFLIITIILLLLSIITIKNTIIQTNSIIEVSYSFKESETYKATKKFETRFKDDQLNNKSIIFSISLPINISLYQKSDNTWQGLTKSDYLFIDFTKYWEQPYEYWKNIAKQNGLNKEILFMDNLNKEKNIVLFYK